MGLDFCVKPLPNNPWAFFLWDLNDVQAEVRYGEPVLSGEEELICSGSQQFPSYWARAQ